MQVGTQEDRIGAGPQLLERRAKEHRGRVHDSDNPAADRESAAGLLEPACVSVESHQAQPAARSDAGLRKVDGEPLLEPARPIGGKEGRPRRPCVAEVDEQATVLRARRGADQGRGGCPRAPEASPTAVARIVPPLIVPAARSRWS